jgi:hypothetical protein
VAVNPMPVGDRNTVTISPSAGNRYYRLVRP